MTFRAGVEGTISFLKRMLRLARCFNRGWERFVAIVGSTVLPTTYGCSLGRDPTPLATKTPGLMTVNGTGLRAIRHGVSCSPQESSFSGSLDADDRTQGTRGAPPISTISVTIAPNQQQLIGVRSW